MTRPADGADAFQPGRHDRVTLDVRNSVRGSARAVRPVNVGAALQAQPRNLKMGIPTRGPQRRRARRLPIWNANYGQVDVGAAVKEQPRRVLGRPVDGVALEAHPLSVRVRVPATASAFVRVPGDLEPPVLRDGVRRGRGRAEVSRWFEVVPASVEPAPRTTRGGRFPRRHPRAESERVEVVVGVQAKGRELVDERVVARETSAAQRAHVLAAAEEERTGFGRAASQ
mmetsp:Transcript_18592/g.58098  ORF Transcript_18592/g.58098 Transcript_18592/m.58098 type:complete len:227 (-) Transcript_18592:297-977(-)